MPARCGAMPNTSATRRRGRGGAGIGASSGVGEGERERVWCRYFEREGMCRWLCPFSSGVKSPEEEGGVGWSFLSSGLAAQRKMADALSWRRRMPIL